MNRQEIRERAVVAANALDECGPAVAVIRLERHFEMAVRATLEDAARVVCNVCRVGDVAPVKDGEDWYHDTPLGSIWCGAGEIHDLIAELESEGSNDQG